MGESTRSTGNQRGKMPAWREQLKFDPLPALLSPDDPALRYFVQRDLLEQDIGPVQQLWSLAGAQKILKKQLLNGSWSRSGENKHPAINVHVIETWRYLRILVDQFGFTREHPQVDRAAEYLFSCQTETGDIRGILANQYATYYTGAIMATLIQAGYIDDVRIERGFQWLVQMRQTDLGWTIPLLTHKFSREEQYILTSEYAEPVEPDRSKPFSHNWTGMVLRAFAAHPHYCKSEAARTAGALLKSRFFQPDAYTSYQNASYWVRFEYPFWWNNLISALDSLARIGFKSNDEDIAKAVDWLVDHQGENGLWDISYMKPETKETGKSQNMRNWISLSVCRVLKQLYL
jgi:hypothetical protein